MKYYDLVILGGGIAGAGLAYNLKRIGYNKKILIIDKKGIGSNAGYGFRNTFKRIVEEYNLPYLKKYKKLRIGDFQGTKLNVDLDFYLVHYTRICNHLFKKSNAEFTREEAIHASETTVTTNKETYKFKHFIDASGSTFFLRKLKNLPLPFRYYVGDLKVYKMKKNNEEDFLTYYSDKKGYVEDLCHFKTTMIQGDWQIAKNIDFRKIKSPKYNLINNLEDEKKLISSHKVYYPVTPVFPLVIKNSAFLGDSFGNATPSLGEGIRPILDSSKILAVAILKDNLKKYESVWKEKYLNKYIKTISSRIKLENRFAVLKIAQDDPNIMKDVIEGKNPKLKIEHLKKIKPTILLEWMKALFVLKIKYYLNVGQTKQLP